VKYSIGNNTWSTTAISYPTTAHDNNGETGILFKGARIYFLGGRTASTQFKYYSFNTNSWFNAADYPVAVQTNDLVAVDNAVYALGGDANHKKFSSYTETSNAWTALPDLPFAAKNSATDHTVAAIVSGSKGMLLFALVGTKIYVYDTQSAIWKATPIETNIVGQNLNLFSDGSVLYIASRTTTGDFSLHKLTVN
jgi:N-acetylneuraminic acid mutarotase